MTFDVDRYHRDVVERARSAGGALPDDLFVRYAIREDGPELRSEQLLLEHLESVAKYWRGLRQQRRYSALVDRLLAAHAELAGAGKLSRDRFLAQRRQAQERLAERIKQRTAGVAAAYTCVSPDTVSRLAHSLGGVAEQVVEQALTGQGVRTVKTCPLPEGPPPKYRAVQHDLSVLGLRLSADVVFGEETVRKGFAVLGGFRLTSGLRLDDLALEQARTRWTARRDDATTSAGNILAVLQGQIRRGGGLDDLLLWEVVAALAPSHEAGLPQRALVDVATELGLRREDADVIALSIVEAGAGHGGLRAAVLEVEEALHEGRLRAAQQVAGSLPREAGTEELLDRVRQASERVEQLRSAAERARPGQPEQAAELLAEALRSASDDDDLHQRLRSIPPPPPTEARLQVEGDQVLVRWRPSAARVGQVRYRVARGERGAPVAAGQGSALGETETNEFTDSSPPAGRRLSYSVFATRGDQIWSEPASAGPVVVTPDVAELRVEARPSSVTGSWRLPEQATDVVVRRSPQPPRGLEDGREVMSSKVQFVDTNVRPDVTYHYRIWTLYHAPDGTRFVSGGLAVTATPEGELVGVTDLQALPDEQADGSTLRFTWTPARSGTAVSIYRSTVPPPRGRDVLPLTRLGELGELMGRAPALLPNGRAALSVPAAPGRWFFTAATLGRATAVVGNTVQISLAAPVKGLVARRHGDEVQLGWLWPPDSVRTRVRWWPAESDPGQGREMMCSRVSYEDRGGLRLRVGPGAVTCTIQAVISQPGEEVASAPVTVDIDGLPPRVRYAIKRGGRRGRSVTFTLSADRSCTLPPLVVVQSSGRVMPRSASQGRVVGRIPEQPLQPQVALAVVLDIPRVPGPSWLLCFPERTAAAQIVLVPPSVNQLQAG